MKKLICNILLALVSINLCAQITISEENIQENVVVKPQPFDSLSDIRPQQYAIEYKKYIGYQLFGLPISKEYECKKSNCEIRTQFLHTLTKKAIEIPHVSYEKSEVGSAYLMVCGVTRDKLKGNALKQYLEREKQYNASFQDSTDIYHAIYTNETPNQNSSIFYQSSPNAYYTPYDKIQNTYFTILDFKIGDSFSIKKNMMYTLDKWENPYNTDPELCILQILLRNETTNDTLYWQGQARHIYNSYFALVPYFEKIVSQYKNKDVITTRSIKNLVDINTGSSVTINPAEKWHCYDVTFLHTKEYSLVQPYVLIENEQHKVKIPFRDLDVHKYSELTTLDLEMVPLFIMSDEYDKLVAEKQKTEEERLVAQEERVRLEKLAYQQRKDNILKKYASTRYAQLIAEKRICLNMTKEMCIDSWGHPLSINTTIVDGLTFEQWVYDLGTYVYFENGIISAIQTHE